MTSLENLQTMSPLIARFLCVSDWCKNLSMSDPRIGDVLLGSNSSIWKWTWHKVYKFKSKRVDFKDAVLRKWCFRAGKSLDQSNWFKNKSYYISYQIFEYNTCVRDMERKLDDINYLIKSNKEHINRINIRFKENLFYCSLNTDKLPAPVKKPKNHKK